MWPCEKHEYTTTDLQCACLFIKIHKYIASSPFRSLDNVKRLVVGRTFRLLLLFSIYLPCNFLSYSFHYLFWSGTWSVVCRPVPIVLTKCWKVAHWTVKKLLKGWQKHKRLLPKFQKMLHFFLHVLYKRTETL